MQSQTVKRYFANSINSSAPSAPAKRSCQCNDDEDIQSFETFKANTTALWNEMMDELSTSSKRHMTPKKAAEHAGYTVNYSNVLGFGRDAVYGGVFKRYGKRLEVAIKHVDLHRRGIMAKRDTFMFSEIGILLNCQHSALLEVLDVHLTNCGYTIVFERMDIDLFEVIHKDKDYNISLCNHAYKLINAQIAHAVRYIHERYIVHNDIKPENILINALDSEFPIAKLCDFGHAQFNMTKQTYISGTAGYRAPERVQREECSRSADMWSLGILLHEVFTKQAPFKDEDLKQIEQDELDVMLFKDCNLEKEVVELIRMLLVIEPEERPTIQDYLAHKWFTDYKPL